ncbi:DUF2809 domain-containing protein [Polaribacter sargassicola]|uniref:ribosomal maturation YjgA family protein n=1 Tax=Polaribacter sargassicola TaxID=2836891 RepID=UPI001F2DCDBA|nr:DUF2809 domain-containing protein [Polaribacter sp. DS7-9]MCG1035736.1 DUF2809 domain-containing protein [Polaribacter sp. DS7-9]
MIKLNVKYLLASVLLLIIEIAIARYATGFIRHTLGDYLVVILLYFLIKGFLKITNKKAAIITLIFSFIIEFLQLSNLQNIFPEKYSKTVQIILGTSFSYLDLVAYTLGVLTVYIIDSYYQKTKNLS